MYDDPAQWRAAAVAYLSEGATAGDRLCYVADKTEPELIADLAGLTDRDAMLASGQLDVASVPDTYGPAEVVDPDRQVAVFRNAAATALAAGYRGLRLASEPTARTAGGKARAFAGYEVAVDAAIASGPLSAMCGYRRPRVDADLLAVACAHPLRHDPPNPAEFAFFADAGGWRVTGEVDLATETELRSVLDVAIDLAAAGDVHLDLAGLGFIGVRGVTILVAAAGLLRRDRRLVLHDAPYTLSCILQAGWANGVSGLEMVDS